MREYQSQKFKAPIDTVLIELNDLVENAYKQMEGFKGTIEELRNREGCLVGLGRTICTLLFGETLANHLLTIKAQITSGIILRSDEIIAPWELICLYDGENHDEKFLCEYGLFHELKTTVGESIQQFTLESIHRLIGDYYEPDWNLTENLSIEGLDIHDIAPNELSLLETVRNWTFDALHVCCHAEDCSENADHGQLLLSTNNKFESSTMTQPALRNIIEANDISKKGNNPIVFLNACESGLTKSRITQCTGWARIFAQGRAAVFIGTAWRVRLNPANKYANEFYKSLSNGETVFQAVTAARAATLENDGIIDATGLSYRVFGDPLACKIA